MPADPGGLGCREQMPGPLEGKANWRTPSTSEGWSGFLSTLGNRRGECVLLRPWLSPPLAPLTVKSEPEPEQPGRGWSPR